MRFIHRARQLVAIPPGVFVFLCVVVLSTEALLSFMIALVVSAPLIWVMIWACRPIRVEEGMVVIPRRFARSFRIPFSDINHIYWDGRPDRAPQLVRNDGYKIRLNAVMSPLPIAMGTTHRLVAELRRATGTG
jgi:hypothetical protein